VGCAHNLADSEAMAQFLTTAGFDVVFEETQDADIIVYNTCTVKNPTEDKFFTLLAKQTKPVVLAGCIPQSQQGETWLDAYSAVGVDNLSLIVDAVRATLDNRVLHALSSSASPPERDFLPSKRRNPFIAIIPLLQGCLGTCTYCKTKSARGALKSYAEESIIKQIRLAKLAGVNEVWLVSEDNGAYGLDIGSSLPQLLRQLLPIGGVKVRLGMLNPQYLFRYAHELADILSHDMFYKFLHVPVQSGSDKVLLDMHRPYTIKQCKDALAILREKIPDMTFATDIICGYPTETDEDFLATMDFLRDEQFTVLNISKFYPRPQTPAAKLQLLPTKKVKERSKQLSQWFAVQNTNRSYEGKILSVFFTERGKNNSFVGRTSNYRQVVVFSEKDILGTTQEVYIESTTRDDLRGKIYLPS
jgi:threonylcarbamoyladenosine tRNA methylthiotransferase CDKAL1